MNFENILKDLLSEDTNLEEILLTLPCGGNLQSNTLGILEFSPSVIKESSKAYIYSCGIHGNETAPIEIVNDLIKDLVSGKLTLGHPLLIIFGHIQAMKKNTRFLQDNLNRMFSDHYKKYLNNNVETVRAEEIQKEITGFFFHIFVG